jgi:hypothetical protein
MYVFRARAKGGLGCTMGPLRIPGSIRGQVSVFCINYGGDASRVNPLPLPIVLSCFFCCAHFLFSCARSSCRRASRVWASDGTQCRTSLLPTVFLLAFWQPSISSFLGLGYGDLSHPHERMEACIRHMPMIKPWYVSTMCAPSSGSMSNPPRLDNVQLGRSTRFRDVLEVIHRLREMLDDGNCLRDRMLRDCLPKTQS